MSYFCFLRRHIDIFLAILDFGGKKAERNDNLSPETFGDILRHSETLETIKWGQIVNEFVSGDKLRHFWRQSVASKNGAIFNLHAQRQNSVFVIM